jgi:cytochrome o ubiquinol oxidase subunit 1
MYRGRVRFELPMMWTVAFMLTFVIGGMTGVLLGVPPADFVLHNSLFLVAHFHNVIIGGVLFGLFAGISYWFPKAFGFKLDPFWGKLSFWFWVTGFYFAFMPLYVLGLMGVTRRLRVFDDPSLQIWFVIACFGAFLIAAGILCFLIQIGVSIKRRESLRDLTGAHCGEYLHAASVVDYLWFRHARDAEGEGSTHSTLACGDRVARPLLCRHRIARV